MQGGLPTFDLYQRLRCNTDVAMCFGAGRPGMHTPEPDPTIAAPHFGRCRADRHTTMGDRVTGIAETHHFTAPAEVLFGVLTDPNRVWRRLPRGLRAEAGPEGIRVRSGERVHEFGLQIVTDDLRVDWRALDGSGLAGSVRVEDAPAGGSIPHAEITLQDADGQESPARTFLQDSVQHLLRDVSDNFNAG